MDKEKEEIIKNPIYWASKKRDEYWKNKITKRIKSLEKKQKLIPKTLSEGREYDTPEFMKFEDLESRINELKRFLKR